MPITLQIGPSRFRAPELLFRPDLIGEESEGIHEVLVFAIQKSDMDLRRTLFSNIVLSGGSTLFKGWSLLFGPFPRKLLLGLDAQRIDLKFSFCAHSGFGDRLLSEVKKLAPKDVKIRVGAWRVWGRVELGFQGSIVPHGMATPPALPKVFK